MIFGRMRIDAGLVRKTAKCLVELDNRLDDVEQSHTVARGQVADHADAAGHSEKGIIRKGRAGRQLPKWIDELPRIATGLVARAAQVVEEDIMLDIRISDRCAVGC